MSAGITSGDISEAVWSLHAAPSYAAACDAHARNACVTMSLMAQFDDTRPGGNATHAPWTRAGRVAQLARACATAWRQDLGFVRRALLARDGVTGLSWPGEALTFARTVRALEVNS